MCEVIPNITLQMAKMNIVLGYTFNIVKIITWNAR